MSTSAAWKRWSSPCATTTEPTSRPSSPPRELLELDPRKVFGLTIDPTVLLGVRQARVRAMGSSPYSTYVDPTAIVDEIQYARQLCRKRGWRIVDVSGRAVEENAALILQFLESGPPGGR